MPTAPKRFRLSSQPTRQAQRKVYDERRGSATSRGYNHRWRKAARTFLQRHPLCLGCEAAGLVIEASLVDHVEPHRGDQSKFWDSKHWQPCCQWHHDVVKQRLETMWDRGDIGADALWLNSSIALRLADNLR
ncbi:holin [Devosia sp. H5989]|nr:holin [Devosia sp. H5989]